MKSMRMSSHYIVHAGMKFKTGQVVATPGAIDAFSDEYNESLELLMRHLSGDWGEVSKADAEENDLSVLQGFRILSSYTTRSGVKLWIITEADRSVTTFLLPEEY